MSESTVLFVDDEESILRSLQRSLRKEPYRILTASSGEEGLKVIANEDVELVVSDQRMPIMTGSQFLQKVRECNPYIVRVILSGYAEPGIIVDAINNGGVYRFIAKPWNDDELKAALRQCLEHYSIVQDNRRLSELSARQVQDLERLNLRLASTMAERTLSLALAQDVLESLPHIVLGISRDLELVLSNHAARRELPALASSLPGADIVTLLPEAAVSAVRQCLQSGTDITCMIDWDGRPLRAHAALLGEPAEPRGCVLLLEGVSA